jgi:hypothetical protein
MAKFWKLMDMLGVQATYDHLHPLIARIVALKE